MQREAVYAAIGDHYSDERDKIVSRISRYLGHRANAEDVVQEAYARALKYWNTYDTEQEFGKWFSTILSNSIKDFFRDNVMHGMSNEFPPDETFPKRILQQIEITEILNAEEPKIRQVLKLYLIDGYSSKEVAEIVPQSSSNVRKIVQRFRDKMAYHGKK